MEFGIGPLRFRAYSGKDANGSSWRSTEFAFSTGRKAGQTRRETAVRLSGRSDHLSRSSK